MANHISAWADHDMDLGSHTSSGCYQILFTEMWSPQNTNGDAISGQYVSGNSYARITDYHEVPLRIKAYDNSGWLTRHEVIYDMLYKANSATNNADFNLCYTGYDSSTGSGSGNIALRAESNKKYVEVSYYNRAFATITNVSSAALFTVQYGTSMKRFLKYTTNNKYLGATGFLYTDNSNAQLRFEYTSTNRD